MNKIYLIADTHFGHENIIRYCSRPFSSVDEMDKVLIRNWNSVVKADDKVFMLGDFAYKSNGSIIDIGRKLNGRKTLVKGNHDGASKQTYYDAGFEYVCQYPIIVDGFYILSHEPQYLQANGLYANIFGHVHDNPEYRDYSNRSFCVSAERIGYTPIDFEVIKSKMEECENGSKEEKG